MHYTRVGTPGHSLELRSHLKLGAFLMRENFSIPTPEGRLHISPGAIIQLSEAFVSFKFGLKVRNIQSPAVSEAQPWDKIENRYQAL